MQLQTALVGALCAGVINLMPPAGAGAEQTGRRVDARGTVGFLASPDEGAPYPTYFLAAVSMRLQAKRNASIETEFSYSARDEGPATGGFDEHDFGLLPLFVVDLGSSGKRIRPYWLAGWGLYYHRDDFLKDLSEFRSGLSLGAGTRIYLGGKMFLSPEIRIRTTENSLRVTISLGTTLAGSRST